ncbi:hypothetical protein [Acetobacterium tundrae]|uniref:hypothetical protein n=1 Tax=Acetobacterium tundrae TaxID=132932 RepID=UPI001FA94449|nr:hypothetical protein [Acetobacterium tundrae]
MKKKEVLSHETNFNKKHSDNIKTAVVYMTKNISTEGLLAIYEALDQACVDLVYAADGKALIERMESRHAIHTLEHGDSIGLGTRNYKVI